MNYSVKMFGNITIILTRILKELKPAIILIIGCA